MSIPEEIEQLKTQLDQAADERGQAEILLEILLRFESLKSTGSQSYIDRLLDLAKKPDNSAYKAWGLHYLAGLKQLTRDHDTSILLSREALTFFEQAGDKKGIAACYNNIGSVYYLQGNYPDALKNHFASLKLREEIGDKIGISTCYRNIGVVYSHQGNYPEALKNYFASLKLREELGDTQAIAENRNDIGVIYYRQGKYQEALENQFAALQVARESGDKHRIAKYLNNIGVVYKSQGKSPEALENHFASLKVMTEIENRNGMSNSYNNIGNIYLAQGKYPEAMENHYAALRIREEIGDKYGVASVRINLGHACANMGKYPEALENFRASLKASEEVGAKDLITTGVSSMAKTYAKMGNYRQALENHFAALKINEETGAKDRIAECHCYIGESYMKLGNLAGALDELIKGLGVAEAIGFSNIQKDCSQHLYDLHKMTGRYKEALEYHEKYIDIAKKLENEETVKKIAGLEFDYKIDKKEQEVSFEREKKEALQMAYDLLSKEKERSEGLLLNILPAEVAEELKEKGVAQAKLYEEVTVLFTDFKDFTLVSERLSPQALVDELHCCFSAFDEIMSRHNIEKIKTVGDAYLAVAGLPLANPCHAEDITRAAIEIRDFMIARRTTLLSLGREAFQIRIGIHSGPVVAGIVGVRKYAYDIWGDTVNIAARMEQNCQEGKINISQTTHELVRDKFTCTYRGKISAKNKGEIDMYFVN